MNQSGSFLRRSPPLTLDRVVTQQAPLPLAKGNSVRSVCLSSSPLFPDSTVGSTPVRPTLTWKSKIGMLRMLQINSQAKTQKDRRWRQTSSRPPSQMPKKEINPSTLTTFPPSCAHNSPWSHPFLSLKLRVQVPTKHDGSKQPSSGSTLSDLKELGSVCHGFNNMEGRNFHTACFL